MKTTNYLFTMLALIGGTFVSQSAYALRNTQPLVVVSPQQQVVKGVVVDKKGEPIVGATVSVVGKTMGVITDINGKFSLHVPNETKLRVTYVGYKTIIVTARPNMQIALDEDAGQLSEVVVVGYGTQKKTNLPLDPETTGFKAGYGNSDWSFGRSYPYSRTLSFGVQAVF